MCAVWMAERRTDNALRHTNLVEIPYMEMFVWSYVANLFAKVL